MGYNDLVGKKVGDNDLKSSPNYSGVLSHRLLSVVINDCELFKVCSNFTKH